MRIQCGYSEEEEAEEEGEEEEEEAEEEEDCGGTEGTTRVRCTPTLFSPQRRKENGLRYMYS